MPGGYIPGGDLASIKPINNFGDAYFRNSVERVGQARLVHYGDGRAAASVQGRDDAELHRLPGRRQIFLGEVADLLWQARAGRPAGAGAGAVAAGHEPTIANMPLRSWTTVVGAGWQDKVGPDALHSTIGRHAARAHPLRHAWSSVLEAQWQAAHRQYRQGRHGNLQASRSSPRARSRASASTRRRAACCRTGS